MQSPDNWNRSTISTISNKKLDRKRDFLDNSKPLCFRLSDSEYCSFKPRNFGSIDAMPDVATYLQVLTDPRPGRTVSYYEVIYHHHHHHLASSLFGLDMRMHIHMASSLPTWPRSWTDITVLTVRKGVVANDAHPPLGGESSQPVINAYGQIWTHKFPHPAAAERGGVLHLLQPPFVRSTRKSHPSSLM
jgi:hypothetical protein